MPIRVLYLIDKLETAGTQRNLLEIIRQLDRAQFEPFLIALCGGGSMQREFAEAVPTLQIWDLRKVYDFTALKAVFRLKRFIKDRKIDLVQSHFLHGDILGTAAVRLSKIKIIISRRDEGFWRSPAELAANQLFDIFADYVLANSEAVKKAVIEKEKVEERRIGVVYNGIDPKKYEMIEGERQKIRHQLGIQNHEIVIGTVANMRHAIKGYETLIEALPALVEENANVRFWWIGEGSLRTQYEARVRELKMEKHVSFLKSRSDIPALLSGMDIFCLPSWTEGFPNVVLEAMAAGKPVVATSVGGTVEIIEHQMQGLMVPPKDSKALVEKLSFLVHNPGAREIMGKTARDRVKEKFTLEKMARDYMGHYRRVLSLK